MISTTLPALRKAGACLCGYNRLVRWLQGEPFTPADGDRYRYLRFRHDAPIPLGDILESNGLDDALWALRACKQAPELVRAERLFAIWCVRRALRGQWQEAPPAVSEVLDIAERYASSEAAPLNYARRRARECGGLHGFLVSLLRRVVHEPEIVAHATAGEARTLYDNAGPDPERAFRAVFCGEALDTDALYREEKTK